MDRSGVKFRIRIQNRPKVAFLVTLVNSGHLAKFEGSIVSGSKYVCGGGGEWVGGVNTKLNVQLSSCLSSSLRFA